MLNNLKKDLRKIQNPSKAKILQGFFKTGKGEYGEGQIFLGINNSANRKIAKKYSNLEFIHISECFLLNLLQYFFLNSEMFLIKQSLFYRFIHILINKLKINNFLKNILFNDNNIKFKDLKVNKIVIDHLTPKKIFYFNFYFNFLKKYKEIKHIEC